MSLVVSVMIWKVKSKMEEEEPIDNQQEEQKKRTGNSKRVHPHNIELRRKKTVTSTHPIDPRLPTLNSTDQSLETSDFVDFFS